MNTTGSIGGPTFTAWGPFSMKPLTGQPPFPRPKSSEVLHKVCQEERTRPRQIVAGDCAGLGGHLLKGDTARSRPSDMHRRLSWPTRCGGGSPTFRFAAYAEPWTSRVLRWARRHKTAVSAVAGLVVAATIALAISTVLISGERNEAEAQGRQVRQAVHLLTQIADIGFDKQLDPLQKKFLEKALAYYENFTSRASGDPAVRAGAVPNIIQNGARLGPPSTDTPAAPRASSRLGFAAPHHETTDANHADDTQNHRRWLGNSRWRRRRGRGNGHGVIGKNKIVVAETRLAGNKTSELRGVCWQHRRVVTRAREVQRDGVSVSGRCPYYSHLGVFRRASDCGMLVMVIENAPETKPSL